MRKSWVSLFALTVVIATNGGVPEAQAQCANWQRQCARLWGGGTARWQECMSQPQAQYHCGGGGSGGGYEQGSDLCANWHNECTRLYGRGYEYRSCLRQPQARADCGRY